MNELELLARLLWLRRQLRQRDRWSRERLLAEQAEALRRLRVWAAGRSRFYREFHDGLVERPFAELPVLTKSLAMEHFDALVTDPAIRLADVEAYVAAGRGDRPFRDRYRVTVTSGSTGRHGYFLFDVAEWAAVIASFGRGADWARAGAGVMARRRVAAVSTTSPWHMSSRVAATLPRRFLPALRLDAADPLESIVERLNGWRPDLLVTYASVANLLAEEQSAGRLRIAPRAITTSSEVLTDEMRRRVVAAWGERLFDQYGATECAGIASECETHRGLHLYEDLVIAEVVDGEYRPVPPGVFGEKVLVTVLFSRTQPLIRYELSDSVRLATWACPCGRPYALIDRVQGRAEETLRFPRAASVDAAEVAIHPVVFHALMDTVPATAWQLVKGSDGLRVSLVGVPDGYADSTLVEALRRELSSRGAFVPPIAVERVAAIDRGPGGKAPLIRSTVRPRG
ncbi:MAG: hypothetical protein A2X23_12110 [Chloroflexi bacterium GWC2_73_18]|nr:MAG: hypothetical protein A2X23_12110 [Chloroflexi bacterium GWC2_73_18]